MIHRVLADAVVLLHLAFIVFVVAGGLLALRWRWRWIPLVHLPAAAWGVYIEIARAGCPLTRLENTLRHAAGDAGYSGGFIQNYVVPLIYPGALTRSMQLALAAVVVVANLLVYLVVLRRAVARRG